MSNHRHPGNGQGVNSPNSSSATNPNYFENFSSMSTLASAAHAQGQTQQQNHSIHAHQDHSSAGFSDLDSALYNVLADSGAGANPYGEYDETTGMDGGHVGGHDGGFGAAQSGNVFAGWYEQHGLPDILSNFQGLSDQHHTIRVEQARNGTGAGGPGGLASAGFNGGPNAAKANTQGSQDRQSHVAKSSRPGRKVQRQTTESSEVSPVPPPSQPSQSKASTPLETERLSKANTHSSTRTVPDRSSVRSRSDFRPKTSIPTDMAPEDYARQCILAAYSSRLNPFALHLEEYELLKNHISQLQVTSYLNIRNGILRLWTRNPLVSVTREEASGCAKDYRWFDAADVAYEWLVRRGYINFGCLEVPDTTGTLSRMKARQKTIVVIGAGMAGLGCARQLQGLFAQFGERLTARGEEVPKVVILEGRGRIGGRVYSHPLRTQSSGNLPPGLRCTADMGAQIITGFDNGNPLSIVIRGQLALHYHPIKDNSILYDSDGSIIDKERDGLLENLFNDILDRASVYRHKVAQPQTIEGDRELIEIGRDPTGEGGKVIGMVQSPKDSALQAGSTAEGSTRNGDTEIAPAGLDKLTGRAHIVPGSSSKAPATAQAVALGWPLKEGAPPTQTLDLSTAVESSEHPTLGAVMDEALRQYQNIVDLTPQDMRLLNWHYANLEYANAANLRDLSLSGWDQDIGNEFEGEHAEIIGGYLQVPRGIWRCPTKLDVRKQCVVKRVMYTAEGAEGDSKAIIDCENGVTIEADAVVVTLPLGVLKEQSVSFEPALPEWKTGPIERLGFGTLNKVVLVYEKSFWDEERDMFGLLRRPEAGESLNQGDYVACRGRFYLFWNCIKTSGRPMLVALMAGDAAHQTESDDDDDLVAEATEVLGKMFAHTHVPEPLEVIITRWGKDRFTRGSYSYVGSQARSDDYDLMAKPVGSLYFAGEATCGTHPATVHGAYISGLRAAAEVVESMLGPIKVPSPLVPPKPRLDSTTYPSLSGKRKADDSAARRLRDLREARLEAFEAEIKASLLEKLGERPTKPGRGAANPFLLYQKDHWVICKNKCDEARRKTTNNPDAKASRNEVRAALGQMWRDASDEVKRPYLAETASNKEANSASQETFKRRVEEWDKAAETFRMEYLEKNPSKPSDEEVALLEEAQLERETTKRARKLGGYVEDSDSSYGV
ncbi:hypothetical protein FGG08_001415 [Glutinoglossum americanum]|uniref:Lysine-specific histone demethylase 1 n=1 Tax=Glutinoglossum americanum TaxID=1670608 RepID=A0A9P8I276_9PEZI|nr:hypothetical protein FGG08_001415 [Glutinoglossum americanum]